MYEIRPKWVGKFKIVPCKHKPRFEIIRKHFWYSETLGYYDDNTPTLEHYKIIHTFDTIEKAKAYIIGYIIIEDQRDDENDRIELELKNFKKNNKPVWFP